MPYYAQIDPLPVFPYLLPDYPTDEFPMFIDPLKNKLDRSKTPTKLLKIDPE
jgi:hypothetical protein